MKQKTLYITKDGKEFTNKNDAIEHELNLKRKERNKNGIIKLNSGVSISHDDIVEYFTKLTCKSCPFSEECDNMYSRIRRSTTDAFSLCHVIKNV